MKLVVPLHRLSLLKRAFLIRMARVRVKAARRLRDRKLREWVKYRVAVIREVKRLEELARQEAEKQRLE